MKTPLVGLVLLSLAVSVTAADKAELDARLRKLTQKFAEMQRKPDKRIPAETLRRAQGIVLLDRTKAGFFFAFQGGGGVALVREAQSNTWSPAGFVEANEASLGPQIGVQQSFLVILLMTTNAARVLTEPNFEFGGEARGTAGNASAGVEGVITSRERAMLVYENRKGLFGGVALKGGALAPETDANLAYYRQALTMKDILFEQEATPTEAALELAKRISEMEAAGAGALTAVPSAGQARAAKPVLESPKAAGESKARLAAPVASTTQFTVATEQLRLLLAELHAQKQTNAIRHLHDYLSAQIASQVSADASTTILVLERLREQRTAEAIELLETRLDGALISLGTTVAAVPPAERSAGSLETLQRAKGYRAAFPRQTGQSNIDNGVARALRLAGIPKQ